MTGAHHKTSVYEIQYLPISGGIVGYSIVRGWGCNQGAKEGEYYLAHGVRI